MNERAREAQIRFREPYRKMMQAIDNGNRVKWFSAIVKFYQVAEDRDLPEGIKDQIMQYGDTEMKEMCKELCYEAINRDFVSYVSTQNEGNVGGKFTGHFFKA